MFVYVSVCECGFLCACVCVWVFVCVYVCEFSMYACVCVCACASRPCLTRQVYEKSQVDAKRTFSSTCLGIGHRLEEDARGGTRNHLARFNLQFNEVSAMTTLQA